MHMQHYGCCFQEERVVLRLAQFLESIVVAGLRGFLSQQTSPLWHREPLCGFWG